jgi:hypothetical protein
MTHKIGNTVYICHEPEGKCEVCGTVSELRAYGRRKENGERKRICHVCGMKDIVETTCAFEEMWYGKGATLQ